MVPFTLCSMIKALLKVLCIWSGHGLSESFFLTALGHVCDTALGHVCNTALMLLFM